MKLTDSKVKNAKPRERPYKISDGEGLQLVIRPNGSKLWQFRYRFAEKERTLSLGKYPEVSLLKAREGRSNSQRLLRDHIDPVCRRREQKIEAAFNDRNSFRAVAEEWRERNRKQRCERHERKTWGRLENHVFPHVGRRPIAGIKPLDMLSVLRRIEKKGMTEMSHRVKGLCSSIFRYAIITGRCENDPTIHLSDALVPHRTKHFASLPKEELPEFFEALEKLVTGEQYRIAVKLLLHTAVRTGELRHARWRDIGEHEWRIPAEFTKTRREHVVPLSKQVRELLRQLREITGSSEWLLPNQKSRRHPVMCENAVNVLIARMGFKGKTVGHGFRSLFSTVLNETGFNWDAIERQLAHAERNAVRAAYNRAEYLEERRQMMQWWSDFLDSKSVEEAEKNQSKGLEVSKPDLTDPAVASLVSLSLH